MEQRACPGCGTGMQRRAFARRPSGTLDLDICWACHAIWFDQYESTALTPGAVLELFEMIDAHRDRPERATTLAARCPACRGELVVTHDVQRSNRLTYSRCPAGHGRFTTFYQFLREKNFVRSLTLGEVERLKANVQQVRCSSCGGAVDLAREMACAYCRSPVSILDADAVKKTIDDLSAAERRRRYVDPMAVVDAVLAGRQVEERLARAAESRSTRQLRGLAALADRSEARALDLVGEALHALIHETKP